MALAQRAPSPWYHSGAEAKPNDMDRLTKITLALAALIVGGYIAAFFADCALDPRCKFQIERHRLQIIRAAPSAYF